METLQNMGTQNVTNLEDLCKAEQLYNPSIIRVQVSWHGNARLDPTVLCILLLY